MKFDPCKGMGVRLFAITVLASTTVAMGCAFVHRSPENPDVADMEKCTKVYGAEPGTPAYAYCRQSLERERGLPTAQSQLPPLTPAATDCSTQASGTYCTGPTR
jgi:hypothetical protein